MRPELFTIPGTNFAIPSYGAMEAIGFLLATFVAARNAKRVKANPDLIINLAFFILVFSILGARTFYVIHYWRSQFAGNWLQIFNLPGGGFEFYGGFIGAFIACYVYLMVKGVSKRLYADIVAPGVLFAMGIGRIGCYLFGCCWGGACPADFPLAVQFPYGSPPHSEQWKLRETALPAELLVIHPIGIGTPISIAELKTTIEQLQERVAKAEKGVLDAQATGSADKLKVAERQLDFVRNYYQPLLNHMRAFDTTPAKLATQAAHYRSLPIHPAQLYSAIGPILLGFLTYAYFYRRQRHGMVMVVGLMLYSIERFVEEIIRVDNPQDTFGLTVSQGVSIGIFAICLFAWLILRRLPLRSPRAVPWVSPDMKKHSDLHPA